MKAQMIVEYDRATRILRVEGDKATVQAIPIKSTTAHAIINGRKFDLLQVERTPERAIAVPVTELVWLAAPEHYSAADHEPHAVKEWSFAQFIEGAWQLVG